MHTYTHVYACAHMNEHRHICSAGTHLHMYTCPCVHMYAHTPTHAHMYIHAHTCTHMHTGLPHTFLKKESPSLKRCHAQF